MRPEIQQSKIKIGLVAAAFVIVATSLTIGFAAAATLGNLTPRTLGTSSNVVIPCDPDGVTISYAVATPGATPNPSYSGGTGTNSTWWLRALRLTGVHSNCNGKSYNIVLANTSGTALATLGTGTLTVTAGNSQILTFTAVNTRVMTQFNITVYG